MGWGWVSQGLKYWGETSVLNKQSGKSTDEGKYKMLNFARRTIPLGV